MEKKTKRRPINSVSGDTFQEPKTKKQLLSQLIKKQTKEKRSTFCECGTKINKNS